jgi:hypothetical protein
MSDEWLTYAQAAEQLNLTVEAVRLRALRGRWQKTIGNDKRPRIRLPEEWSNDVQTTVERRERKARNDGRTTVELANAISALRSENEVLKQARADHLAHVETLKAQIAAAAAREAQHVADLEAERERTSAAISAFADLADRLDQLASERARPWWRRLTG